MIIQIKIICQGKIKNKIPVSAVWLIEKASVILVSTAFIFSSKEFDSWVQTSNCLLPENKQTIKN